MTYKINQKHLQDFKKGKIAIEFNSDIKLLQQVIKEAFPNETYLVGGGFKYYFKNLDTDAGDNRKYIDFNSETNLPTIPLLDFIQEEQFPKDDFGVIVENSNAKEIFYYLMSKGFLNNKNNGGIGSKNSYYYIATNSKEIDYACHTNPTSKTYTLQQLKQLDNNNMETTKKILTYKLVKEEYAAACIKIIDFDGTPKTFMEYKLAVTGNFVERFIEAGVLDLWFEPVYEKQEKVISMGSFNLTVNPEGIFHNSEDITDYVKTIYQQYAGFDKLYKFGKYDFKQKDIILSKTGCENSETKLSQWLAVWEEYIKIKQ